MVKLKFLYKTIIMVAILADSQVVFAISANQLGNAKFTLYMSGRYPSSHGSDYGTIYNTVTTDYYTATQGQYFDFK